MNKKITKKSPFKKLKTKRKSLSPSSLEIPTSKTLSKTPTKKHTKRSKHKRTHSYNYEDELKAYNIKIQKTKPYSIFVTFGKQTEKVTVLPKHGVLSSNVKNAFSWTDTQKSGILVAALKNKNGEIISFSEDQFLCFETSINSHAKIHRKYFLNPDEHYELIIEDIRSDGAHKKALVTRLRNLFDDLDLNKNGVVEIFEVKKYYEIKEEEAKKKWDDWVNKKMKNDQEGKKSKKIYQMIAKEGFLENKKIFKAKKKRYLNLDVDNDGFITWDEFLHAELQ